MDLVGRMLGALRLWLNMRTLKVNLSLMMTDGHGVEIGIGSVRNLLLLRRRSDLISTLRMGHRRVYRLLIRLVRHRVLVLILLTLLTNLLMRHLSRGLSMLMRMSRRCRLQYPIGIERKRVGK